MRWQVSFDGDEKWSARRRELAPRIALALYGVVGIMSADLAVKAYAYETWELVLGALGLGLALTLTRSFDELVRKETEIGAHLEPSKIVAIVHEAMWIMAFPVAAAAVIIVDGLAAGGQGVLLDFILYFGLVTICAVGFLSSYVLDGALGFATRRAIFWLILGLLIVLAKKLA